MSDVAINEWANAHIFLVLVLIAFGNLAAPIAIVIHHFIVTRKHSDAYTSLMVAEKKAADEIKAQRHRREIEREQMRKQGVAPQP